MVGLRRAQAVDARHGGDDDDVPALEQGSRRRVPHPVDLVVDRRLLLDVGVALRDVRLRLVVVVVRHEVLDRVFGEEAPELLVQLRRQGLVVRQDQRRPLDRLDHLGHGERLAASRDAEQHLVLLPGPKTRDQLLDGLRLVALGLEVGDEFEESWHRRESAGRRPITTSTSWRCFRGAGNRNDRISAFWRSTWHLPIPFHPHPSRRSAPGHDRPARDPRASTSPGSRWSSRGCPILWPIAWPWRTRRISARRPARDDP